MQECYKGTSLQTCWETNPTISSNKLLTINVFLPSGVFILSPLVEALINALLLLVCKVWPKESVPAPGVTRDLPLPFPVCVSRGGLYIRSLILPSRLAWFTSSVTILASWVLWLLFSRAATLWSAVLRLLRSRAILTSAEPEDTSPDADDVLRPMSSLTLGGPGVCTIGIPVEIFVYDLWSLALDRDSNGVLRAGISTGLLRGFSLVLFRCCCFVDAEAPSYKSLWESREFSSSDTFWGNWGIDDERSLISALLLCLMSPNGGKGLFLLSEGAAVVFLADKSRLLVVVVFGLPLDGGLGTFCFCKMNKKYQFISDRMHTQ